MQMEPSDSKGVGRSWRVSNGNYLPTWVRMQTNIDATRLCQTAHRTISAVGYILLEELGSAAAAEVDHAWREFRYLQC